MERMCYIKSNFKRIFSLKINYLYMPLWGFIIWNIFMICLYLLACFDLNILHAVVYNFTCIVFNFLWALYSIRVFTFYFTEEIQLVDNILIFKTGNCVSKFDIKNIEDIKVIKWYYKIPILGDLHLNKNKFPYYSYPSTSILFIFKKGISNFIFRRSLVIHDPIEDENFDNFKHALNNFTWEEKNMDFMTLPYSSIGFALFYPGILAVLIIFSYIIYSSKMMGTIGVENIKNILDSITKTLEKYLGS